MRDVDLRDEALSFAGALDLETTDDGLIPRRLPAWTRAQIDDEFMDLMVAMPSGVRLNFVSDATSIELDVHLTLASLTPGTVTRAIFELVLNGVLAGQFVDTVGSVVDLNDGPSSLHVTPGHSSRVVFQHLSPGEKVFEIWLPQAAVVAVQALRLNDGATLRSAAVTRRRWLHYGSSISHGLEADAPTGTWPAFAARAADVELTNLSFAGHCLLDQFVARTIRDLDVDLISLKIGINIVNQNALDIRTFAPALHGFLDTIRERHRDVEILVVSPIYCPIVEEHPGPTIMGSEGRFVTIDDSSPVRAASLTLRMIRATLERVVTLRRFLGDAHLHYLDGLELFGVDDVVDLFDDLHPNARGYRRMGARFVQLAFDDGVFSST